MLNPIRYFSVLVVLLIHSVRLYSNDLEKLWSTAITHNPSIQAQREKTISVKKMVTPAKFPADPMLSLNYMNQPVESGVLSPMSAFQIMVSQNIPFPTKLHLRGGIQYTAYQIEAVKYQQTINTVKRDIQIKYIQIMQIKNILNIEEEKHKKLQLINTIANTKYALGKGLQQDILKVSVAELQSRKMIIKLKSQMENLKYDLLNELGINDFPDDLEWNLLPLVDFDKEIVMSNALNLFPALEINRLLVKKSREELALARWDYLPNLGLTFAYNFRNDSLPDGGVDLFTVGVSASIPVYSFFKQLPLDQSKLHALESSRKMETSMILEVKRMVNTHFQSYIQDREIVDLFEKNIIQESEQSLESSLNAYQVDKVDFLNVLNSLLSLYQQESEYQEVRASALTHQTWLEFMQWSSKNVGENYEK